MKSYLNHCINFFQLVRKIIRQTFEVCKKQSWNKDWVVEVGKVMQEILTDSKTSLGLSLHITEIYMEELAKVVFSDFFNIK